MSHNGNFFKLYAGQDIIKRIYLDYIKYKDD